MFLLYFPNGGQQEGGTLGVEKRRECGGCLDSSKLRRADTKSHQGSEEEKKTDRQRRKSKESKGRQPQNLGIRRMSEHWNKKDWRLNGKGTRKSQMINEKESDKGNERQWGKKVRN